MTSTPGRKCAMCKQTEWMYSPDKREYVICTGCGYSRKLFDFIPKNDKPLDYYLFKYWDGPHD